MQRADVALVDYKETGVDDEREETVEIDLHDEQGQLDGYAIPDEADQMGGTGCRAV